ncbi:hypothetical protein NDU88_005931 [Pleurodeles waltl]|uniref:Uncharacterized protein n=1 Tax=Pleurodeles waltl TaxID=8319 RepID=A0AAV7QJP5_PLEWA|nr:hypothetical protein NDU88_005931 [Pleurodeles waltl]
MGSCGGCRRDEDQHVGGDTTGRVQGGSCILLTNKRAQSLTKSGLIFKPQHSFGDKRLEPPQDLRVQVADFHTSPYSLEQSGMDDVVGITSLSEVVRSILGLHRKTYFMTFG